MSNFVNYILSTQFCASIMVVTLATLLWVFVQSRLEREAETLRMKRKDFGQRGQRILLEIGLLVYIFIVGIIIAGIHGVDITAAIAGLGVVGVAGTFVAQDLLKDIIVGVDIYVNKYFKVGDYLYLVQDGQERVLRVDDINLKVIKLYEDRSGDEITMTNRLITDAQIFSGSLDLKIPFSYDLPLATADAMFDEMLERICAIESVTEIDVVGIDEMDKCFSVRRLRVDGAPATFWTRKSDVLKAVAAVYEKYGMTIPSARQVFAEPAEVAQRNGGRTIFAGSTA